MNEEMNWLLTDEFIAFSEKIKTIHEKRKLKKQELKDFYEKIQIEMKSIEAEALFAENEFQVWKQSQTKIKSE